MPVDNSSHQPPRRASLVAGKAATPHLQLQQRQEPNIPLAPANAMLFSALLRGALFKPYSIKIP